MIYELDMGIRLAYCVVFYTWKRSMSFQQKGRNSGSHQNYGLLDETTKRDVTVTN